MEKVSLAAALDISDETADALERAGAIRRYPGRSYLSLEGDESTHVYFVRSGVVRIDRVTESGRQVLFELATPGDLVGELGVIDDEPRSATMSTMGECELLALRAADFMQVMTDRNDLAMSVMRRVVVRMRALSDQLVEVSVRSASSRVAARLLKLIELNGNEEPPFDLPLMVTQEELGQWAGLSREGVVKGLAELRGAGALDTGRRRVTVYDIDKLRDISTSS